MISIVRLTNAAEGESVITQTSGTTLAAPPATEALMQRLASLSSACPARAASVREAGWMRAAAYAGGCGQATHLARGALNVG